MPLLEASIADLQVAAEAFEGNHLRTRRDNSRGAQRFDIHPVLLNEPVPFGDDGITATGIISTGVDLRRTDEHRARVEVRAALKLSNGTILFAAVPVEDSSASALLEVNGTAELATNVPPLYSGSRRVALVGEKGLIAWPTQHEQRAPHLPPSKAVDYAERLAGLFRRLNAEMSEARWDAPKPRSASPHYLA